MLRSNDEAHSVSTITKEDPLHDLSYLQSPIDTIMESLRSNTNVSHHDLMDSYNTFTNRLRSLGDQLEHRRDNQDAPPALQYFRHYASPISQALHRDISLAHADPFSRSRPSSTSQSVSLISTQDITPDVIQYARDISSLCLHAFCSLSVIVRFPALYAMFSDTHLNIILSETLSIAQAKRLPIHNSRKIHALSLWIIQFQRLPLATLSHHSSEIIQVLRGTLEHGQRQDDMRSLTIDGLKGIRHLISNYASVFLALASDLLPLILSILASSSPSLRLQAALVLGSIAHTLTSPSSSVVAHQTRITISENVLNFLNSECSKKKPPQDISALPTIFQVALAKDKQPSPGDGPTWALSVLASFIILSDHTLFSHSRALKFCFRYLAISLTHSRSAVRALHPSVWRCLVWAFGRLPGHVADNDDINVRHSAFQIIKQELSSGIGIALIATLLAPTPYHAASTFDYRSESEDISKALTIVNEMVKSQTMHTSQQGLSILEQLTKGVAAYSSSPTDGISTWNIDQAVPLALLDGTILNSEWRQLPSILRAMQSPSINYVRCLSEIEIMEHHEMLSSIWVRLARNDPRKLFPRELIRIWQSLLLVEAQLTQGRGHLTTPSDFATRVAYIVIDFLPHFPTKSGGDSWQEIAEQARLLSKVRQLWTVVKNVFVAPCLAGLAELILTGVLQHQFHLNDEDVRDAWSVLCAELISVNNPSFVKGLCLHIGPEKTHRVLVQRELWGVAARCIGTLESKPSWEDMVIFLSMPFGIWAMSDSELDLWEIILQSSISTAKLDSTKPSVLIERFTEHISDKNLDLSLTFQKVVTLLLSHLQLSNDTEMPNNFLSLVDALLCAHYPPNAELLQTSLDILRALRTLITSSSVSVVISMVFALRQGLSLWIEDQTEELLEDEYNEFIIPLYSDTLHILENHSPSPVALVSISCFLAAGFVRIPPPAIGPMAFEKFWKATYHQQTQFYDNIPANIKACLRAFQDAFGGDLCAGSSQLVESQTGSSTTNSPSASQNLTREIDAPQLLSDRDHRSANHTPVHPAGEADPELTPTGGAPSSPRTTKYFVSSPVNALHQLQDYASHLEESVASMELSPSEPSNRPHHSPVVNTVSRDAGRKKPSTKRKSDDSDNVNEPAKRSRTADNISLRRSKRFISQPVTRVTSPVILNRTGSAPAGHSRRALFDGVELPTMRQIVSRERASKRNSSARRGEGTKLSSARSLQASGSQLCQPSPPLSEKYDDSDEIDYLMPSEMEVETSLAEVPASSPLHSPTHLTDTDASIDLNFDASDNRSRPIRSQSQVIQSPPHRLPLRRSKTTSTRLDILQDFYAAVSNGASQIPVQELLQATKLVHQIGAVLSEQMGKKFGGQEPEP